MQWEGIAQTQHPQFPFAVFIDEPNGPLDRIAHHPDVATFLNDRFHAIFLTPQWAAHPTGMLFLDADGCVLLGPVMPDTSDDWIDMANQAVIQTASTSFDGIANMPTGHPLAGRCLRD